MSTYDENILSDLHKDARGFRPRGAFYRNWNAANDDVKQHIWDGLVTELQESKRQEALELARCEAAYEATIAGYMENGAKDRATAIRWMLQNETPIEHDQDAEHFLYCQGVLFGKRALELLNEILAVCGLQPRENIYG